MPVRLSRWMALLLVVILSLSSTACTTRAGPDQRNLPPVDDTQGGRGTAPQARQTGMSMGKKMVMLAGAAALYYMYRQHQNRQGSGPEGQYYLSRNGRVYYRDAQHRAHWVTPPPQGIQVPAEEAAQYQEFQGYQGRRSGRDLTGLTSDAGP